MEQFKQLKWSWHKYEEEKDIPPRSFSFETINDADALNRNLNEIHMSVLRNQDEYRLFKTPEEIVANSFGRTSDGKVYELQDPRKHSVAILKPSHELVSCYSYLSEINRLDQICILNATGDKQTHNSRLLKQQRFNRHRSDMKIPLQLQEKWNGEAVYFNKCAEIHYHRHIKELSVLLRDDLAALLITHWDFVKNQIRSNGYQAITMISRAVSNSNVPTEIKHVANISKAFNQESYTIMPESYFPALQNYSIENLKHHFEQQQQQGAFACDDDDDDIKYDLKIPLSVMAKLFVTGKEFTATFRNKDNNNMTRFLHNYSIPSHSVDCCEALEEAIEALLISHIEWTNVNKSLKSPGEEEEEELGIKTKFPCMAIDSFMERIYSNFKKQACDNIELNLWTLENKCQAFTVCVSARSYFVRENVRAVISIKFEYQTNFGAEQMTKEELLREWIQQKFTQGSVVLRYRIDAKSLEILSIEELSVEEIENELGELYNCNPNGLLHIVHNLFRCLRNLPPGDYLIQAKNENECSKFMIYKEDVAGKSLPDLTNPTQISQSFVRSWLPVSRKVLTFIHLNEFIAPCCFSHKALNKSSYMLKNASTSATCAPKAKKIKMDETIGKQEKKTKPKPNRRKNSLQPAKQLRKSNRVINKKKKPPVK